MITTTWSRQRVNGPISRLKKGNIVTLIEQIKKTDVYSTFLKECDFSIAPTTNNLAIEESVWIKKIKDTFRIFMALIIIQRWRNYNILNWSS